MGWPLGHHGFMGKQNLYEHSTKVPFLICGPDIKKNHVINEPIYLQDIMPTTLQLAGLPIVDTLNLKFAPAVIRINCNALPLHIWWF